MSSRQSFSRRHGVRAFGAVIAVTMLFGGTAACSSDSDSKSADKSSSETDSKSDSASKPSSGSDEGRPDGFPEDIPLPEFSGLNTILSATDDTPGLWSIVLTIDPTLEESGESLMADYGAKLEDAGYEVSDLETGYASAENEKWIIDFRSSMAGTLTIGTSPK